MSELTEPVKANLTISVMFRDAALLEETRGILTKKYGEIDAVSEVYDFSSISPYYDQEMGSDIKKIVFSFKEPVPRESIKQNSWDSASACMCPTVRTIFSRFMTARRARSKDTGWGDWSGWDI